MCTMKSGVQGQRAGATFQMSFNMSLASAPWSWQLTLLRGASIVAACGALSCGPALAQQASDVDELAAQATDPTASLMSFQLNDWYTANLHDIGGALNQVVFRAAIPFTLGDTNQIFRITQPYVTSSPTGATGFADTTIFDLVVSARPGAAGVSASRARFRRGRTDLPPTSGPPGRRSASSIRRTSRSTGACLPRPSSRSRERTPRRTSA